MSREELRDLLGDFEDYFQSAVKEASTKLVQQIDDPQIRRKTLLWKVSAIPACHTILKQEDAIKAFLDGWVLAVRMRQYFEEGDGRDLFDGHQAIAVKAAKEIERDIERIGARLLSPERLARTRQGIVTLAKEYPIRGQFTGMVLRATETRQVESEAIAAVLSLPLVPFRAFGGIDRGAAAIVGLTDVADRFTDVVEGLPESVRWQWELMALDIEQNEVVRSARTSWEEMASSAKRLTTVAEQLPDEVHFRVLQLLDESSAQQAMFQATLDQARATSETVRHALEQVETSSRALDETARSVTAAGTAWRATAETVGQTVKDMREDSGASPSTRSTTAPAAEFDVKDYRKAADSLTKTAIELQQLTLQIHELLKEPRLTERIEDIDKRLGARAEQLGMLGDDLADRVAWRVGELILLTFGLFVIYRLATLRRRAPQTEADQQA